MASCTGGMPDGYGRDDAPRVSGGRNRRALERELSAVHPGQRPAGFVPDETLPQAGSRQRRCAHAHVAVVSARLKAPVRQGMRWVTGGTFSMGDDRFYPEE